MSTIDKKEIEKFSKLAKEWWNPEGKFRPLHLFNPARIKFIKEKLIYHFNLDSKSQKPLEKLKILDIGSGGGLLCEPLYRLGAKVTGIDASVNNIQVAKLHSKKMGLNIDKLFIATNSNDILHRTISKGDMSIQKVKAQALRAKSSGSSRICMGAAWRNVKDNEEFDLASEDLRLSIRHLGTIVGKVDVEEILGSIFENFCIGK